MRPPDLGYNRRGHRATSRTNSILNADCCNTDVQLRTDTNRDPCVSEIRALFKAGKSVIRCVKVNTGNLSTSTFYQTYISNMFVEIMTHK